MTCGLFVLPVAAAPQVTAVTISGAPNPHARGAAVFDPVQVRVTADRFTEDNLLTPAGLGWNRDSRVVPLSGAAVGRINSESFWTRNNPQWPVTAYALAAGTAGRITHVGDTRAGTRLDLPYTVTDTDATWWQAHSDYAGPFRVHGIAFTGEQYLKNTTNNAIVVLYNGANRVKIHYQIVRHGTNEEVPVLVSFIATDIDVSQGVMTNLHNLARLIPQGTNLREAGGMIYDQSSDAQNPYGKDLNGAADLPAGGYLGVCFNSHFDYTFYAPAPANAGVYRTASGVRYDLFGSALQAKMAVDRQTHLTVRYQDNTGRALKPAQEIKSLNTFAASPAAPKIRRYRLTATRTQTPAPDEKRLTYTYTPETTLTIRAVDQASGRPLAKARTLTLLKGQRYQIAPPAIRGYRPPKGQTVIAAADQTVTLGYRKIAAPSRGSQPKTRRAAPRPKRRSARRAASPKRTAPRRAAVAQPQARPAKPAASKKKAKAKQKIDWFEKNTGIEKDGRDSNGKKINEQKVFFDVLKAIEQDGKKHHKSAAEIKRDQLYFMARKSYVYSKAQCWTSHVEDKQYDEEHLKTIIKAYYLKTRHQKLTKDEINNLYDDFYTIVAGGRKKEKVDLPHLAIAAAGALDRRPDAYLTHWATTLSPVKLGFLPGIMRVQSLVTHALPANVSHNWVFANGYFGDWMTEWQGIHQSDLDADIDIYAFLNPNEPLRAALKKVYNRPTKGLNKNRARYGRGMRARAIATLLGGSLAALGLIGWGLWDNFLGKPVKKAFKKAKSLIKDPQKVKQKLKQQINRKIVKPLQKLRHQATSAGRKAVRAYRKTKAKVSKAVRHAARKSAAKALKIRNHVIKRVRTFKQSAKRRVKKITHRIKRIAHRVKRVTHRVRKIAHRVKKRLSQAKRAFKKIGKKMKRLTHKKKARRRKK